MADEVRTVSATGGAKGRKIAEIAWIDPQSIMEVAEVAGMGATKYGEHNFRNGYEWSKCYNALHRHLGAFWSGQDLDDESGLPHVAHAAWHCLALITFSREHPEYDDRWNDRPVPSITTGPDRVGPSFSEVQRMEVAQRYDIVDAQEEYPREIKNVHGNVVKLAPGSGMWNKDLFPIEAHDVIEAHNLREQEMHSYREATP